MAVKRLNELEDTQRVRVHREIEQVASKYSGTDKWGESTRNRIDVLGLGLCQSCTFLNALKTEFGTIMARCPEFEIKLNANDPVKECTNYEKVGQVHLRDMFALAVLIEINKRETGFLAKGGSE